MSISQGAPDSGWFSTPEGAAWLTASRTNPTMSFDAFHSAWQQAHPSSEMTTASVAASPTDAPSGYPPQPGRDLPGTGTYGQTGGAYDFSSLLHPAVPVAPAPAGTTPAVGVNPPSDQDSRSGGDSGPGGTNNGGGTGGSTGSTGSGGGLGGFGPSPAGVGAGIGGAIGGLAGGLMGPAGSLAGAEIGRNIGRAIGVAIDPPTMENSLGPEGNMTAADMSRESSKEAAATANEAATGTTEGGRSQGGGGPAGPGSGASGGDGTGGSGSAGAGDGGGGSAGSGGDGEGCFIGHIPILMADRTTKPIRDVVVGDMVMAFDKLGPLEPRRVIATMVYPKRVVIAVAGIMLTGEHPFLIPSGEFVCAKDLCAGDTLVKADGEPYVIRSTDRYGDATEMVHNIEVEDLHTYVAGGFRVHNKYARGGIVGNSLSPAKGGHRSGQVSGRSFNNIGSGIRAYGMGFANGGFATANTHGVGAGRSVPHGLVPGASPGRADALHASVKRGSYIMPADVVSAIGGGNTANGGAKLNNWVGGAGFKSGAGMPGTGYARGGLVDVRLSSGEYHVPPEFVHWLGKGDPERGAKILDGHVARIRAKQITHLRNLPPPK